ncbi:MAG: hypothetical protein LBM99_05540 [Bacillales bacterium]|nr:hypothetical protein [Bacillales bacterium]
MKKLTKIIAPLALLVLLAGCTTKEIEARPSDYNETLGDAILKDVYDSALTQKGYSAMAEELLYRIALAEKIDTERLDTIIKRLEDKVTTFQKDATYIDFGDYEKNPAGTDYFADGKEREYGTFKEEKAVAKLRVDGETLSDAGTLNLWNPEEVLKEVGKPNPAVVNTYISRTLYRQVVRDLLNEDYIIEKKSSYFKTSQFRRVEYTHVDFVSDDQIEATNRLYGYEKSLMENDGTTLEDIEADWQAYKVGIVNDEIAKIGTIDDEDQTYSNKYLDGVNLPEVSKNIARKNADEAEYYVETKLYANTDTIVNSTITSRIFTSSIGSSTNKDLYLIEDQNKTDNEGNTVTEPYYFLKTYVVEPLPIDSIIQDEAGTFYFVRLQIVNNIIGSNVDEFLASDDAEKVQLKWDVAEKLTEKSSNLAGNILYYLNKYKIGLHDQAFADYLKETYSYPEED